jgi:putative transposase
MQCNDAGQMVESWWWELNNKYPTVATDAFIVMSNHFHGILLVGAVAANSGGDHLGRHGEGGHIGPPLPGIVQWFKTMTTNAYIRGGKEHGWTPFAGKVWPRNYDEPIIRSEAALERLRSYIASNPQRWLEDEENPNRSS